MQKKSLQSEIKASFRFASFYLMSATLIIVLASVGFAFNGISIKSYNSVSGTVASYVSNKLSVGDELGARQYLLGLIENNIIIGARITDNASLDLEIYKDGILPQVCVGICLLNKYTAVQVESKLFNDNSSLYVTVIHDNRPLLKTLGIVFLFSIIAILMSGMVFSLKASRTLRGISGGFESINDLIGENPSVVSSEIYYSEVESLFLRIKNYATVLENRGKEVASLQASAEFADRLKRFAHDIRSPLMAIGIVAELKPDKLSSEHINLLNTAARRAEGLATELLREYKQKNVTTGGVDLTAICRQIIREKDVANQKKIVLGLQSELKNAVTVSLSETYLARIYSNLLNNAIDASEIGGRVMTNIKQGPTTVKISIIDFGKGIDPETLSLIKLGRSVSKGKDETYDGGTGIGLSSAFRYIHEAGGNIEVESNVGTGTTIRVSLPIIFKDRT